MAEEVEYIDIYTDAGVLTVDVTATIENGIIDSDEAESTSEMLLAVRKCIQEGNHLLKPDGWPLLVDRAGPRPIAYGYRREEKRNA